MSAKFERFASAVWDYPKFKDQFSGFCKTTADAINNNSELPGVALSLDHDKAKAKLRIFDQDFVIRFHLVALPGLQAESDQRIGVLGIYLPVTNDEEILLWRTFFDIHGNVKDTPDARSAKCHLCDKDFLPQLLGELADKYFSRLTRKFDMSALVTWRRGVAKRPADAGSE